jgi:hypothetical protein
MGERYTEPISLIEAEEGKTGHADPMCALLDDAIYLNGNSQAVTYTSPYHWCVI